ncbi:hypothetical protein ACO0QE_003442 [Hanseniaspora vineae]
MSNLNDEPKRKRKNTKRACTNCAKAHATCDSNRPCSRCIQKNLSDSCVDKARKKSKYLQDIPDEELAKTLRSAGSSSTLQNDLHQRSGVMNNAFQQQQGFLQSGAANALNMQFAAQVQSLSSQQLNDTSSQPNIRHTNFHEQQFIATPQHIIHKPVFQSSAIDSEYSSLSNILSKNADSMLNKIPVNILNNRSSSELIASLDTTSPGSSVGSAMGPGNMYSGNMSHNSNHYIQQNNNNNNNNNNGSAMSSGHNSYSNFHHINAMNAPQNPAMAAMPGAPPNNSFYNSMNTQGSIYSPSYKNMSENLVRYNLEEDKYVERANICKYLGPQGAEVLSNLEINLLEQHFPLVPLDVAPEADSHRMRFSASLSSTDTQIVEEDHLTIKSKRSESSSSKNDHQNSKCHQTDLVFCGLKKNKFVVFNLSKDDDPLHTCAYSLQVSPENKIYSNTRWPHSLQYDTPRDIYTKIQEPFFQTQSFVALLEHVKSRFKKEDVLAMCRDLSAIRPILIAGCIDLKEEDMIFMEHSYQRTLLQYVSFINQVGTPTIIWRRSGLISYVNDEFCVLTGWSREVLLGKMTFILEILSDECCLEYFHNFKSICYSDYKGSKSALTLTVQSPVRGKLIECVTWWTLKRDVFGLPLMIIANFLPK